MEFIEEGGDIYKPIRALLNTPLYERALRSCWNMGSYRSQIALLVQLMRLQQENQLPSVVTAEDMTELLVEQWKCTLSGKLSEHDLESSDKDETKSILKLVWEVNTRMKMRDIEFEARRLLDTPGTIPPQFKHRRIMVQAQVFAKSLTEQRREAPSCRLLGPREVVMEVVPKVLQSFWPPLSNNSFNVPSQKLSKMAAAVTKAVEDWLCAGLSSTLRRVAFCRSVRDRVVLSVREKVRDGYSQDILANMLTCFAAEVLYAIADVTAREIYLLFHCHTRTEVRGPGGGGDGAEVTTGPAGCSAVHPEPGREPGFSPSARLASTNAAAGGVTLSQEEAEMKIEGRIQGYMKWFMRTFSCFILPDEEDWEQSPL